MSLASNFGKLKSQAGMEEWEGAVGAGWEATGRGDVEGRCVCV